MSTIIRLSILVVLLRLAFQPEKLEIKPVEIIPQPTHFMFQIEAPQGAVVLLSLDDEDIEPNHWYKTEPLDENTVIEIEVRFIDGGRVIKQTLQFTLEPGTSHRYTITVNVVPKVVWC